MARTVLTPTTTDHILLQNGDNALIEDNSVFLMESGVSTIRGLASGRVVIGSTRGVVTSRTVI